VDYIGFNPVEVILSFGWKSSMACLILEASSSELARNWLFKRFSVSVDPCAPSIVLENLNLQRGEPGPSLFIIDSRLSKFGWFVSWTKTGEAATSRYMSVLIAIG